MEVMLKVRYLNQNMNETAALEPVEARLWSNGLGVLSEGYVICSTDLKLIEDAEEE